MDFTGGAPSTHTMALATLRVGSPEGSRVWQLFERRRKDKNAYRPQHTTDGQERETPSGAASGRALMWDQSAHPERGTGATRRQWLSPWADARPWHAEYTRTALPRGPLPRHASCSRRRHPRATCLSRTSLCGSVPFTQLRAPHNGRPSAVPLLLRTDHQGRGQSLLNDPLPFFNTRQNAFISGIGRPDPAIIPQHADVQGPEAQPPVDIGITQPVTREAGSAHPVVIRAMRIESDAGEPRVVLEG